MELPSPVTPLPVHRSIPVKPTPNYRAEVREAVLETVKVRSPLFAEVLTLPCPRARVLLHLHLRRPRPFPPSPSSPQGFDSSMHARASLNRSLLPGGGGGRRPNPRSDSVGLPLMAEPSEGLTLEYQAQPTDKEPAPTASPAPQQQQEQQERQPSPVSPPRLPSPERTGSPEGLPRSPRHAAGEAEGPTREHSLRAVGPRALVTTPVPCPCFGSRGRGERHPVAALLGALGPLERIGALFRCDHGRVHRTLPASSRRIRGKAHPALLRVRVVWGRSSRRGIRVCLLCLHAVQQKDSSPGKGMIRRGSVTTNPRKTFTDYEYIQNDYEHARKAAMAHYRESKRRWIGG